jgi:hypothetical protein
VNDRHVLFLFGLTIALGLIVLADSLERLRADVRELRADVGTLNLHHDLRTAEKASGDA